MSIGKLRFGLVFILFGLILIVSSREYLAHAADAQPVATMLEPRSGAAVVWTGSKAYILGGTDGNTNLNTILEFDPSTGIVLPAPGNLQIGVTQFSAVWDGSKIYTFAGKRFQVPDCPSCESIAAIQEYSPVDQPHSSIVAQMPSLRHGASAVWDGIYAYIFGGITGIGGGHLDEIVRFDPAALSDPNTPAVDKLDSTLSHSRNVAPAVLTPYGAFIFGGYRLCPGGPCDDIEKFDPVTGVANLIPTKLPQPLVDASAVWSGRFVYIFGGSGTDRILAFDPTDESIAVLPDRLPSTHSGGAAFWDGQAAYIVGGSTPDGPSDEIWRYVPEEPINIDLKLNPDQIFPSNFRTKNEIDFSRIDVSVTDYLRQNVSNFEVEIKVEVSELIGHDHQNTQDIPSFYLINNTAKFIEEVSKCPSDRDLLENCIDGIFKNPDLAIDSCNTDNNGICEVFFASPEISGVYTITAESDSLPNAFNAKNINVKELGLEGFDEQTNYPHFILTGQFGALRCDGISKVESAHRFNHFGDEKLKENIQTIANRFYNRTGKKLRVNDMSLAWGGLFDIGNDWSHPHKGHRIGVNADIEWSGNIGEICGKLSSGELNELEKIIRLETLSDLIIEGIPPHFHTCRQEKAGVGKCSQR